MVRSNPRGEIGFLNEFNRLYVSLSRARAKLFILMHVDTFRKAVQMSSFTNHLFSPFLMN